MWKNVYMIIGHVSAFFFYGTFTKFGILEFIRLEDLLVDILTVDGVE